MARCHVYSFLTHWSQGGRDRAVA